MSSQKFTAAQREAIWIAHNKKCAYSGELLEVNNFHIDHIIPERVIGDLDEFKKIKEELGLTDDFDPLGFENLLPCKPGINQQKTGFLFPPPQMQYFLSIASQKKTLVESNLAKIEKRGNRGKALFWLNECLQSGELTHEEIAKILEEHNEQPEEIFPLIVQMGFAGADEVENLAKSEIENFRALPVKLGTNTHINGVTLTNDANEKLHVQTCKEYDDAISAGYYALSSFDMKMEAFFKHQCGLLQSLSKAMIAEKSFIEHPRAGIVDLTLLPFSLFPAPEGPPTPTISSVTYQDKIDDGTIRIKRLSQNSLLVEEQQGGMGQRLIEVVRADFNGDGVEDILLFEYIYATHGTFGYGDIRLLTRRASDEMFEIVSEEV